MRIVSYNVRYFAHALRGLASTGGSKRAIAAALSRLDPLPAVVCLQEVETISLRSRVAYRGANGVATQLESFMGELEAVFAAAGRPFTYEAFYFPAHENRLRTVPIYTTGLAVIVDAARLRVDRHNAEAPHDITHHRVLRWKDRKQTRICAHLRLSTADGRPFHVFNTHLSLPTPFARKFWTLRDKMGWGANQAHEARALAGFARHMSGGEPFVVCGDFNSPPASPVWRILTGEQGLTCAQRAVGQIDGEEPRAFPTAGFMHLRMHLDHLFSGGGIGWEDLEGTVPFGDGGSPFAGLSDHVPLIGRFRLGCPD